MIKGESEAKRIQGISLPKNIVLEQTRDFVINEKWEREHNEFRAGIYEGSECVSFGIKSNRIYPSGAFRTFLESVSISLADTEVLVSLRDLLDEAVEMSVDYQKGQPNNPANVWSAGIYRENGGWNHFLTVIALDEDEARDIATDKLLNDWESRNLWDAWLRGEKQVRNRAELLKIGKSIVEKIGDVICPSCREPVDLDEWHGSAGMCVSCKIAKDERVQAQIEVDIPLEIDPEE
jgi:hypothetical protein